MVESVRCLENEIVNHTCVINHLTVDRNEHGNPKTCDCIRKVRKYDNRKNCVNQLSKSSKNYRKILAMGNNINGLIKLFKVHSNYAYDIHASCLREILDAE